MKREQLREAIKEAWRKMHHNASISRYYPKFRNEYEGRLFHDYLGFYVESEIEYLNDWIKEDFGITLTFYQYGRCGATIAPDEFMRPIGGDGFGSLNTERAFSDAPGIEGYNADRETLRLLNRINKFWRGAAQDVGQWWQDTKEANDLQARINEHDGKRAVIKEVWV